MPNGDYFIIDIYGLFPTSCASFRPVSHFSAEVFEDEYRVLPLCIYGLSPEITVVAFTDHYIQYSLRWPFTALGTR